MKRSQTLRRMARLVVVGSSLALLMAAFPGVAGADAIFGQRSNPGGATADGIISDITPNSFGPTPHTCVLFSVAASDYEHQVEAGVVRCGSQAIFGKTGECRTEHSNISRYVEIFDGFDYTCQYALNGAVNSAARYEARQVNDGTVYGGLVQGKVYLQVSIENPAIRIWGEESALAETNCGGWSGDGTFRNTRFYHRSDGYHNFSTFPESNVYIDNYGNRRSANCWSFGAYNGSYGTAHIFRREV